MPWTEVAASIDTYTEINSRELQDESGNPLLDESGNLLIGDTVDIWTVQAGTGETWTDV